MKGREVIFERGARPTQPVLQAAHLGDAGAHAPRGVIVWTGVIWTGRRHVAEHVAGEGQ